MKRYILSSIQPLRNEDFATLLDAARNPNIRPSVAENLRRLNLSAITFQLMENPGISDDLKQKLRSMGNEYWSDSYVWSGEYIFICNLDEDHADPEEAESLVRTILEHHGAVCDDISVSYRGNDSYKVKISAQVRFARSYNEGAWYEIRNTLPALGYHCDHDIEIY